ncbi:MAG: family oxidoreductase [Flaviaesturariibacter sp.]|nr:family oxidoreductase [Flaviaesturariibacter sp.]
MNKNSTATQEANVIIVGSGIAGSLVANMLLAAGASNVVMLEAGADIPMEDHRSWYDAISTAHNQLPYDSTYDLQGDFTSSGVEPWNIQGGRIIGRGGSTIHWGGWTPRFMPEDFCLKTNTGLGIDWPFAYADLEPYYCLAEQYLGVAGITQEGQRDWRSQAYPMAGPVLPLTAQPIISALQQSGYIFGNMPVARNTVTYNDKPQCITTGTCYYCPIGARFTGNQPLDKLASNPNFTLMLNSPVTSLVMGAKNTVTGVQYLDTTTGQTQIMSGVAVFLCSGAFEIPKLMQLSTSAFWPDGIGNDNDLVGRYLVANPYIYCSGGASTNPELLQQELNFPNLCSRQWDTPEEQATGKFLMNMSYEAPLVNPAALMYEGNSAAQIAATVTGPFLYELQGGISPTPSYNNRVTSASGTTRYALPRTAFNTPDEIVSQDTINRHINNMIQLYENIGFTVGKSGAYPQRGDHASSTCRMATTDSDGVVDDTLKVFGTDNLYVASNAALPTIGAANLTLTLVATIMRAMDKILNSRPSWV